MTEFFRFLLHRNTFSPLVRPVSVSSCRPPFCLSPAVLSPLSSLPCAPPVMISLGTLPPSNFCAVHRPSSLLSRPSSPRSLVFVCCCRRRHLPLLLSPFLLTFSPPPLAFPLPLPSSFPPSSLFLSSALLFFSLSLHRFRLPLPRQCSCLYLCLPLSLPVPCSLCPPNWNSLFHNAQVCRISLPAFLCLWLGWAYISKKVHGPWHQGVCFNLPMVLCA